MKSREELLAELASNPAAVAEYALQLQEQLSEARTYIAELKRQLFGPKADKLTPEQEEQLRQVAGDLKEHNQRPPPVSQDVLEPELQPASATTMAMSARASRSPVIFRAFCIVPPRRFRLLITPCPSGPGALP